jgi:hypothetical protein
MGLKLKDPNGEWRSTGGGGGKSNLLVVTVSSETGECVSSHTYQEIKAFVDGGGEVVLREFLGEERATCTLGNINAERAQFSREVLNPKGAVAAFYSINADGTVTYDFQYWTIPSDDHINELIDGYLSEALGGDY